MARDKIEHLKSSKIGQLIVQEYDEEALLKMDQKELLDQQVIQHGFSLSQ